MAGGCAGLSAVALLVLPLAAGGALACEAERWRTGLAAGLRDGVLAIVDVGPDTPAARAGFRAGDTVVQINAVLPRSCRQWDRAVLEARDQHKAVLVLVRREGQELPLALGAAIWDLPGEERPAMAVTRAGENADERRRASSPVAPAQPLPPETPISIDDVLAAMADLPSGEEPRTDLAAYQEAVGRARQLVETLHVRAMASPEVLRSLQAALRHYEAAIVAWEAMEGPRMQERRSRQLPVPENRAVPYFADSPVASLLDEFDFLGATVAREPGSGPLGVESAGAWRPAWARLLLWERGARAVVAVRARLEAPR